MNIKEIRDIEEMLDGLEDKADEILIWVRAKRDEIEEIKAQKILRVIKEKDSRYLEMVKDGCYYCGSKEGLGTRMDTGDYICGECRDV